MPDKTKKTPEPTPPASFSSRLWTFVFFGIAIYVGLALKNSYDIHDVQTIPIIPVRDLVGPLAANDRLANGEILLKGKVVGPESFLADGGKLYTGTQDGKIVEITDGQITKEFVLNPACDMKTLEGCFRPLGIRRLNSKEFIVVDAWQGLYTVNMNEMKIRKILDANMLIDGEPMLFADDIDVIDEENIVMSDASTRNSYHQLVREVLEGVPSGRLLHVNIRTRKVTVLAKGFYFANGVQLFPDKKSVLLCETFGFAGRIHRIYLEGEKKGKSEIFLDNLPGHLDNIRLGTEGTFWVAFAGTHPHEQFSLIQFGKKHPLLRRMLLTFIPQSWILRIIQHHQPKHAMTVEVSQTGEILSSLHDNNAKVVSAITQTTDDGTYLYLGSYHEDYIVRVKK